MGVTFITDSLAVYRLTRLATKDTITEPVRFRIKRAAMNTDLPDGVAKKLETLISCPWCLSVYLAVGVVAARRYLPEVWAPAATVLAFSAVTGLIAENLD